MSELFKEMFLLGRYKPSQGKIARQLTAMTIAVLFAIAAWRIFEMGFTGIPLLQEQSFRALLALVIAGAGAWFAYRLIHFAPFADFLISVEAEMIKVYWPPKNELYSSTIVVLIVFALLAILIFAFDIVWAILFRILGVLPWWNSGV